MWPSDTDALIALQRQLATRSAEPWSPPPGPLLVGGCWVCFPRGLTGPGTAGDRAWAAAVVLREGELADQNVRLGEATAPYAPGLLAARGGPMVALGALAFTIQIYADFSGYSDMAVGLGRLMGFRLMYNFNLPFFAVSPSDFWRRWHISLSQCLRDNLYIPLGGNRKGFGRELAALMITMLIGGLWHGAQWHFVLWGAYCGGLLILERLLKLATPRGLIIEPRETGSILKRLAHIAVMFPLTILGFLIFRAESIGDVGQLLANLARGWDAASEALPQLKELLICTWLLGAYQIAHYFSENRFFIFQIPVPIRALVYFIIYLSLTLGAPHDARTFIYFQF